MKTYKQNTQKADILEWFEDYGPLQMIDAFTQLGITQVATRIHEMKNDGHKINTIYKLGRSQKKNRSFRYAVYSLDKSGKDAK